MLPYLQAPSDVIEPEKVVSCQSTSGVAAGSRLPVFLLLLPFLFFLFIFLHLVLLLAEAEHLGGCWRLPLVSVEEQPDE